MDISHPSSSGLHPELDSQQQQRGRRPPGRPACWPFAGPGSGKTLCVDSSATLNLLLTGTGRA